MEIKFDLGGSPALFRRDRTTGRAEIIVDERTVTLAHPYDPRTHFSFSTRKTWQRRIGNHQVRVIKHRPVALAGLRDNSYSIEVDGLEVASATGT